MSVISVSISNITYSSYRVSWTDSLTILGAGLTHYENGVSTGYVDVTGLSEYTVSVTEGISFSSTLAIEDADGLHSDSGAGTSVLRAPVATSATLVSGTEIQVNWTCDAGTESGFYVYYKESGGSYALGRTEAADATNGTVVGLTGGKTYYFKVVAYNSYTTSDDSNEVSRYIGAVYSDSVSDSVTVSESVTTAVAFTNAVSETVTATDSFTAVFNFVISTSDTVTVSDSVASAQSIRTDCAYYWGTSDGYVHTTSEALLSDNGTAITSSWTSKTLDFAEDSSDNTGRWKTIYKIEYVFKEDDSTVLTSIGVSNDGGDTWTTIDKYLGTNGDGRMGSADYFWNKTGEFFVVKITWTSADKEFQFLGMDVVYDVQGDSWSVV